jgi:pyruvate formate lyase activating enzyme
MYPARELMFSNTRCANRRNGCARCLEACPYAAIAQNRALDSDSQQLSFNRTICRRCESQACLSVCYFEGLKQVGDWYSVDELMRVLERNRSYWGTEGGVSFSGGEPLLQHEFMRKALEACREQRIHTAVETTAHVHQEIFFKLMNWIDFAFIDIKHMHPERHREKTGESNELVLSNIESLASSNWPGRLVLRMPLIKGYNDTQENLEALADFMQRLGLSEINLLPFHRLGESKWTQLGREYPCRLESSPAVDEMLRTQDFFLGHRIACYNGSGTPF